MRVISFAGREAGAEARAEVGGRALGSAPRPNPPRRGGLVYADPASARPSGRALARDRCANSQGKDALNESESSTTIRESEEALCKRQTAEMH